MEFKNNRFILGKLTLYGSRVINIRSEHNQDQMEAFDKLLKVFEVDLDLAFNEFEIIASFQINDILNYKKFGKSYNEVFNFLLVNLGMDLNDLSKSYDSINIIFENKESIKKYLEYKNQKDRLEHKTTEWENMNNILKRLIEDEIITQKEIADIHVDLVKKGENK